MSWVFGLAIVAALIAVAVLLGLIEAVTALAVAVLLLAIIVAVSGYRGA